MIQTKKAKELFDVANEHIPGGVNSPKRALNEVDIAPVFVERGDGARVYDCFGNSYLDYAASSGSLIFGHAHPQIVKAVSVAAERGTSFGMPTRDEVKLAELIKEAVPSIEKVRIVSSGTEAVMSAVRLARGFTKRRKIVKFEGCSHGHADVTLVGAGSGKEAGSVPASAGIPDEVSALTISIPFNNMEAVRTTLFENAADIACVILEPISANMGVVTPEEGFLDAVRKFTAELGIILIFDEVVTGFRLGLGGAQVRLGIKPDLTCLGGPLGGGLSIGAFGGREEIMSCLAPTGDVFQAGTMAGNPLSTACAIKVIQMLKKGGIYEELAKKTDLLIGEIAETIVAGRLPVTVNYVGSMFAIFFTRERVHDYKTALLADTRQYALFFKKLLERGVFFAPSQLAANFVSAAHSEEEIRKTAIAVSKSLKEAV